MSARPAPLDRLLVGIDRQATVRWLLVAAGLLAVQLALYAVGLVGVRRPGAVSGALGTLLAGAGALAVVAAAVQAYRNDGLLVSLALAFTPLVAYAVAAEIPPLVSGAAPVRDVSPVALYGYATLYALVLGGLAFLVGTGLRHLRG